jgi:hypothetical protein
LIEGGDFLRGGIEIEEWPARIAETALWLMDHQMNLLLAEKFGPANAVLTTPTATSAGSALIPADAPECFAWWSNPKTS